MQEIFKVFDFFFYYLNFYKFYFLRALREPMKGWTDAISAAGALFLLGGLGLLSFVPGTEEKKIIIHDA